jgi:hypothetical protein
MTPKAVDNIETPLSSYASVIILDAPRPRPGWPSASTGGWEDDDPAAVPHLGLQAA